MRDSRTQPRRWQAQGQLAEIVRLPVWSEESRGAPNELLRSALFNARNRKQRRAYLKGAAIAVIGDGTITFTGEELRQDDEDVWLQILHLAHQQPLGDWVGFTGYSMLRALGWGDRESDYARLRTSLFRMTATVLYVHSKRLGKGLGLSLIRKFECYGEDGQSLPRWRIWIEPEMRRLFGETYYTLVEWEQRKQLAPLAKWLHGLYASHKRPYPMKVETLQKGSGSEAKQLYKFRQLLKAALDELKGVGFLKSWALDDNDRVHVERTERSRKRRNRTIVF